MQIVQQHRKTSPAALLMHPPSHITHITPMWEAQAGVKVLRVPNHAVQHVVGGGALRAGHCKLLHLVELVHPASVDIRGGAVRSM